MSKHLPSWWPKLIHRMKSDHNCEQMKATQTKAVEQNNSACYVSSFMCSCSFILVFHSFFLFFSFTNFLFQQGAQQNEAQKVSQQLNVSFGLSKTKKMIWKTDWNLFARKLNIPGRILNFNFCQTDKFSNQWMENFL